MKIVIEARYDHFPGIYTASVDGRVLPQAFSLLGGQAMTPPIYAEILRRVAAEIEAWPTEVAA